MEATVLPMRSFDAGEVADALGWPDLIEAIERAVLDPDVTVPERTVHPVATPAGEDATLLLKPGWRIGDIIAVKVVTFFPDNGDFDLPTVTAGVLLFDATNGVVLAACDGNELTTRRTAAASAVASKRLSRVDATELLVVGTGALAPMAAQAHAAVRGLATVRIWGRRAERAEATAANLAPALPDVVVAPVTDLDEAVARSHIICCVTSSTTPLVRGEVLSPGAHVDLIGSFSSTMRESDDDVMRRGSVWVDTFEEACAAGDISQAIDSGALSRDEIVGDLASLVAGSESARTSREQITVFKSAGTAIEDVAAAGLLLDLR